MLPPPQPPAWALFSAVPSWEILISGAQAQDLRHSRKYPSAVALPEQV
jgi:hypothetical protein